MSENMDLKSLVSIASAKGTVSRDGPDAKTRNAVMRQTRNGNFDGFLNTFLGREKTDKSSKGMKTGPGSGSGLRESNKEAVRKSMNKTSPSSEELSEEDADVVAQAAEEAANIILELLYGSGVMASSATSGLALPEGLRQLAGLTAGDMATANASAEMNSDAILASLDELLDGLPRHAVEEALFRLAGQKGMENDVFNQIATDLNAQIMTVNTASGSSLLNALNGNNSSLAAEIADGGASSDEFTRLFEDFLEDKMSGKLAGIDPEAALSGDAAALEGLAEEFGEWLGKDSNLKNSSVLRADANRFLEVLVAGAGRTLSGDTTGKLNQNSEFTQNLEKTLHSLSNRTGNGSSLASDSVENSQTQKDSSAGKRGGILEGDDILPDSARQNASYDNAALGAGQQSTMTNAQQQAQPAQQATQQAMSTMASQIENIERIAEAVKQANRNGINNITMQLAPAELGRVTLRVESRNGVVSAKLKVERSDAAAQLAGNLDQLRNNLKAMGIELGNLEITHQAPSDILADLGGQGGYGHHSDPDSPDTDAFSGSSGGGKGLPEAADDHAGGGTGSLNLFA